MARLTSGEHQAAACEPDGARTGRFAHRRAAIPAPNQQLPACARSHGYLPVRQRRESHANVRACAGRVAL